MPLCWCLREWALVSDRLQSQPAYQKPFYKRLDRPARQENVARQRKPLCPSTPACSPPLPAGHVADPADQRDQEQEHAEACRIIGRLTLAS